MKILAIRGKNLASLANEFGVDFTSEPLASAGLYAITGATGSGKSTLLDALCLALYERTPRLARASAPGESIPDVGEHSVGPGDPRTILRRGASDGFAEVDFVGSDAVGYRARWSVRRARGKRGGRLQQSEVSLLRLSDQQALGDHRKSETLKLIERCIGLTFEQFSRAVLLAQNDFSAFLKASDDERAELLQTLTGSQTFTRISMQAFARARSAGEGVRLLKLQIADQLPLADDARAAKAGELAARERDLKAGEQRQGAIEAQLRWHQQAQKLQVNCADAAARLDAAQLAKRQAATRQAHFERVESVQPARARVAEAARLDGECAAGAQTLAAAQALLAQAVKRVDDGQALLAGAARELLRVEQASAGAQPALDRAKALDAQIGAATPNCLVAQKARDAASMQLAADEARQSALGGQLAAAQSALQDAQRWLVEHARQAPLAAGWQRWETLLAQASAVHGDSLRGQAQVAALATQEGELATALAKARADQAARSDEQQAAARTLAEQTQALAACQPEDLAAQRQGCAARRDQLASAAALVKALDEQQQRRQQLAGQRPLLVAALTDCATQIAQYASTRPLAERDLAAAEKTLRGAELAASASVEQLRSALEDGQACPVCGACEHPYAQHNPALAAVLGGLRDEVTRRRQALAELLQGAAAAQARQQLTGQQLAQIDRELAAAADDEQRSAAQWRAHPLAAQLTALTGEQCAAWLAAEQAALQASLARLERDDAHYRAALQRKDAAQAAASAAQNAAGAARDAWANVELDHQRTAQASQTARLQLADLDRQLAAAQAELDAAFPDALWRAAWRADPADFVRRCRADVDAWAARQQQVAELSTRSATLSASQRGAADAVASARRQQAAQAAQCAQLEADLQAKQVERRALFDGEPVSAVEAALAAALTRARTDLSERQASGQRAEADRARYGEAVRLTATQLAATQAAATTAQQAIDGWLQAFNARHPDALTMATLKPLLDFDERWIGAERQALQALDGAIANALAVHQAHQQAHAEHQLGISGEQSGEQSAEQLQQALDQALAELAPARAQLAALGVELARDDERRGRSQALVAELEKQGASARVWAQLGELIGSADGKKFRNFAQQLTLDILLGYANRHLETLSRRYRLQRISDSLGLLVVDQDMGDELRSVHSLSGGESFLVSLALALALASLSSHRVCVESLFIDEGFGSLDGDALSVAMAALDSLQAQGRKVGVISHVAEMSERIGTQIEVKRLPGGQSRVRVMA